MHFQIPYYKINDEQLQKKKKKKNVSCGFDLQHGCKYMETYVIVAYHVNIRCEIELYDV